MENLITTITFIEWIVIFIIGIICGFALIRLIIVELFSYIEDKIYWYKFYKRIKSEQKLKEERQIKVQEQISKLLN